MSTVLSASELPPLDGADRVAITESVAATSSFPTESPESALKVGALLFLSSKGERSESVNQAEDPVTRWDYDCLVTDLRVTRLDVGLGDSRDTSLFVHDGDVCVFHVGQSDPLTVDELPLETVLEHLPSEQVALLQEHLAPDYAPAQVALKDQVETAIGYLETLQISGEGFDALLDAHQQVLHEAVYTQCVSLTGLNVNAPFTRQTATYHGESYTVRVESENTPSSSRWRLSSNKQRPLP